MYWIVSFYYWIKSLFIKYKRHKLGCYATVVTIYTKGRYINTAKHLKGKMIYRFNVYEKCCCDVCGKELYNIKIATNLTQIQVFNRYNLKVL